MSDSLVKLVENFLDNHCVQNKYTTKKTQQNDYLRIEVSNIVENIPLTLYNSGKLVVGGSPRSKLHTEFKKLKEKIENEPQSLTGTPISKAKACTTKYNILLAAHRSQIKDAITKIEGTTSNVIPTPTLSEEFRIKINSINSVASITQYTNGTLLIQGKEGNLFTEVCEIVEKTATPSEQEVIARFLSSDESKLQEFTLAFTPELLAKAENNIIGEIGDAFHFLEPYDKKYFIASECLRLSGLPLPEFSAYVMPAAKGFEGFAKKLLVKLGFYPSNHFAAKTATFSNLSDKTFSGRTILTTKEKYAGTYLDKLANGLDMTRNFMMHSDSSTVTKVDTPQEASAKLKTILGNTKEAFDYFNKPEFGGIYP